MTSTPLDEALTTLHDELDRIVAGGDLDEARMLELVTEVERRLEEADSPPPPTGAIANLRRWAESFELEHPRTAALVNRIMQSLGDTGI